MNNFSYTRAGNLDEGIHEVAMNSQAKFIAGGTNLLDLMKENVSRPDRLVDINHLPLAELKNLETGGVELGALMTNADTAYHPEIEKRYPLLSKAILAGASPQLRNMATNGGNLLQRTRCYYFYDTATPCNKRQPGSGCSAVCGVNRIHAIFGTSEHCIATHPSDMCVALAALEAVIHVQGSRGKRSILMADFHRLPEDHPEQDTNLEADELITSIELPALGFSDHNAYVKVRDRYSYAFALVSVAAGLEIENNVITKARLVLGGVAHKPWRNKEAEALLYNHPPSVETFERAASVLVKGARGYGFNTFKIELARRTIVRALREAAGKELSL